MEVSVNGLGQTGGVIIGISTFAISTTHLDAFQQYSENTLPIETDSIGYTAVKRKTKHNGNMIRISVQRNHIFIV